MQRLAMRWSSCSTSGMSRSSAASSPAPHATSSPGTLPGSAIERAFYGVFATVTVVPGRSRLLTRGGAGYGENDSKSGAGRGDGGDVGDGESGSGRTAQGPPQGSEHRRGSA